MFDISELQNLLIIQPGGPIRYCATSLPTNNMINNNLPSHQYYDHQEEEDDEENEEEEEVKGRVKAAVLPMGGPASRRVKREVEGGALAKCKFTRDCERAGVNCQPVPSVGRHPGPLRPPADPHLPHHHHHHLPPLPPLLGADSAGVREGRHIQTGEAADGRSQGPRPVLHHPLC